MTVLPPCFLFGATRLPPTDCFQEVEQTEEDKHSSLLGKRDPCVALKESQRVGSFVAAGQWGCVGAKIVHHLKTSWTQPNGLGPLRALPILPPPLPVFPHRAPKEILPYLSVAWQ